jgi:hypothetical protein
MIDRPSATYLRLGLVVAALGALLAGCDDALAAQKRDAPDRADAARQIAARQRAMGYDIPFPRQHHQCTEFYDLGQPQIVDMMVEGTTATVKTSTRVQSKIEMYEGDWQGKNCLFPAGRGTWPAGAAINLSDNFQFKRWDSGWRLEN